MLTLREKVMEILDDCFVLCLEWPAPNYELVVKEINRAFDEREELTLREAVLAAIGYAWKTSRNWTGQEYEALTAATNELFDKYEGRREAPPCT